MNPFDIKEILQYILKIISRPDIMPCVLTCKYFQDNVLIDHDQESVAKNGDMYSLRKINFSSLAVVHIAIKYDHIEMVRHLMNQYPETITSNLCVKLGYVNKYPYLTCASYEQTKSVIIGACLGQHYNLFENYQRECYKNKYFTLVGLYSLDKKELLERKLIDKMSSLSAAFYASDELEFVRAKMAGKSANKNKEKVMKYIQKIFDNGDVTECYNAVFISLVMTGHYDIVKWLIIKMGNDYGNLDDYSDLLFELIINNEQELFFGICLNKCLSDSNKIQCRDDGLLLVLYCIYFKRKEMLTFLLSKILFSMNQYNKMFAKAQQLKFDDMETFLKANVPTF